MTATRDIAVKSNTKSNINYVWSIFRSMLIDAFPTTTGFQRNYSFNKKHTSSLVLYILRGRHYEISINPVSLFCPITFG